MSVARKVVDSTFQRVLSHISEIVRSIVLLIIICLPLAYAVPMWIQYVAFGVPFWSLTINPVAWFGTSGAVFVILLLAAVSLVLGYPFVSKMTPKPEATPAGKKTAPEEETGEEEPEIEAETVAEAEIPSEEADEDDRDTSESGT